MKAQDLKTQVTAQIIEDLKALEATPNAWKRPWTLLHTPHNLTTGKAYKGINVLLLSMQARLKGYNSGGWCTYKQAQALGGQVRKGEKSSCVLFYSQVTKRERSDRDEDEQGTYSMAKTFQVFNFDQIDDLEPELLPECGENRRLQGSLTERLLKPLGAKLEIAGEQPCYRPGEDLIRMPIPDLFFDQSYAPTLLHELGHWTGHKSRCARDLEGRFGDAKYAAEELVAELVSAHMMARLGLRHPEASSEHTKQHASYIKSWIRLLEGDDNALFKADGLAQQAIGFIEQRLGNPLESLLQGYEENAHEQAA